MLQRHLQRRHQPISGSPDQQLSDAEKKKAAAKKKLEDEAAKKKLEDEEAAKTKYVHDLFAAKRAIARKGTDGWLRFYQVFKAGEEAIIRDTNDLGKIVWSDPEKDKATFIYTTDELRPPRTVSSCLLKKVKDDISDFPGRLPPDIKELWDEEQAILQAEAAAEQAATKQAAANQNSTTSKKEKKDEDSDDEDEGTDEDTKAKKKQNSTTSKNDDDDSDDEDEDTDTEEDTKAKKKKKKKKKKNKKKRKKQESDSEGDDSNEDSSDDQEEEVKKEEELLPPEKLKKSLFKNFRKRLFVPSRAKKAKHYENIRLIHRNENEVVKPVGKGEKGYTTSMADYGHCNLCNSFMRCGHGYTRQVTIHYQNCPNKLDLDDEEEEEKLPAFTRSTRCCCGSECKFGGMLKREEAGLCNQCKNWMHPRCSVVTQCNDDICCHSCDKAGDESTALKSDANATEDDKAKILHLQQQLEQTQKQLA
ncbi:MAG: hypothetical protein SGARI_001674, partial [Bacillariaceae sp.]